MRCFLLLFLFAFSNLCFARGAQEICGLDNARVTNATNFTTLRERTCPQLAEFPIDSVREAGNNILRIIQALEVSQQDIYEDENYQTALTQFEETLNQNISQNFEPVIRDRKGRLLNSLFSRYSSVAQRENNPEAYVRDLTRILSESERGREAIDCFNDTNDSRVSGTNIIFTEVGDGNERTLATYNTVPDESNPGKYIRTIEFNPRNMLPEDALMTLAHEMKHACMTSQMIDLRDEAIPYLNQMQNIQSQGEALVRAYNQRGITATRRQQIGAQINQARSQAASIDARLSGVGRRITRLYALDEVKAYQLGADIFNEFAVYHPPSFCNGVGASSFFGGVLSKGQYASSIQADLASGNFIHSLIENYSRGNGYDPSNFYQTRVVVIQNASGQPEQTLQLLRDSQGQPILDPDFQRQYNELLSTF